MPASPGRQLGGSRSSRHGGSRSSRRGSPAGTRLVLLGAILLLALALRVWRLDTIAPGIWFDEAVNTQDALNVWHGDHPIFFEGNNGREALYIYSLAPVVGLLGPGLVPLRLVSVFYGLLLVLGTYLLAREMFNDRVGLLAGLLAAISYWPLHASRTGFRAITLPAVLSLGLYFVWRGIRRRTLWCFPVGGALLGLALHTYLSSRFVVPGLIGLCLLALLALGWRGLAPLGDGSRLPATGSSDGSTVRSTTSASAPWPTRQRLLAFGLLLGAALVVAAPLGYYLLRHPADAIARTSSVDLINPLRSAADRAEYLANSLRTLGLFSVHGDWNPRHNYPGRPLFDPIVSLFFVLGIVICLRRQTRVEGLFLLGWLFVALFPLTFTAESPHFLRTIGVLPGALIFPAVGLDWLWRWLASRRVTWQRLAGPAIATISLTLAGGLTVRDYFFDYATRADTYEMTTADNVVAAEVIDRAPELRALPKPSAVYLSSDFYYGEPQPLTAIAGHHDGIFPFDARQGMVFPAEQTGPLLYVLPASRTNLTPGNPATDAPEAKASTNGSQPPAVSAPQDWSLVERYFPPGSLVARRLAPSGADAVRAYYFAPGALLAHPDRQTTATFGDAVQLVGYDLPRQLTPGQKLPLTIYWRDTAAKWYPWVWAVTLIDSGGQPASRTQLSDTLTANDWRLGEVVAARIDVPVSAGLGPGLYRVRLEIAERRLFDQVRVYDGAGRDIGTKLELGPVRGSGIALPPVPADLAGPTTRFSAAAEPAVPGLAARPVDTIDLAGYRLGATTVRPGDTLDLSFAWRVERPVGGNYHYFVHLLAGPASSPPESLGAPRAQKDGEPLDGRLPTSVWQPGEVLADKIQLAVPADMPAGPARLIVGLYDLSTGQRLTTAAGRDYESVGEVVVAR